MSRNHQISTSANPAPPPVEPYILRPPEWRGPLSSEADLGFPDFYPSRPAHGQDEDCLSELFVKQGYVSKWGISQASESFSVHGVLLKELGSQAGLARMGSTLSSLLSTRQASASSIGPSTYRLPPRYTLHDSKRLTFVADLANPLVPLHKLSKSIPHGFKGGELLEMLWSNGVSLERGVWFAKVVGASEMQRPQGKPQPPPNHYSLEWTNACTTWLKKQLAEITLPSVPRPGFSVKQAFKSILSDPQSRERWVAKWNFSCSLTRSFFAHSLLDNRTFLSWLVQQIAPANLAQIGFVSRLIEEYLEQILASGALARLMVEGLAAKTMEIVGGSAKGGAGEKLEEVKIGLARILQSTFLQAPTLFVSPKLYTLYSNLFNLVLSETPEMTLPASPAAREEPLALAVIAAMREQWEEIKRRNVGLLFMSGGGGGWSPRRQAMADINILDSICSTSDMAQISLSFFTTVPTPPPSSKRSSSSSSSSKPTTSSSTAQAFFPTKLDILLSWSIAYAQFGAHRPSSVSTLLLHHRARHPGCDAEVQELVFKWVAESEVAAKEENREAVAETVGELMRVGVVGYAGLLITLMSRGLTAGFRDGGNEPSPQLKILRSIPLYSSTSSLLSQRRVALYGLRASTGSSDDDALAELVNQELDAAFPELAAQSVPSPNEMEDDSEPRTGSMPQLATLLGAPKFIQIDCVHRWLKKKGLSSSSDDLNLNSELLAKLIYLLEQVRDFSTMLELLFSALECPSSNSLISPIIFAFKRYADVWTAMEAKGSIAEALFEKHLDLRGAPTPHRELLEVLFEMGEVGCLSEEDRTVVVNDMSVFEKSFFPSSHHPNPPPSNLDEVQMLSHELDPQAGPALATTLWYRYHAFDEWPFVVWQNVVLAIALLTSAVSDPAEQLIVVDRYARFLDEVHKHIPSGLDRHLRRWFRERADQDQTSDVFGRGLDGAMVNLLLQLALAGCIETVTIVDEVVLPVWKLCALKCRSKGSEAIFSSPLAISLQSVNILATRLLLVNSPSLSTSTSSSQSSPTSSLPPRDLEQIQRFQTSAVACFEDSSFVKLVTHLPFVVALEVALLSGDPLAASCGSIWAGLSKHQSLKVAAFRHSGTIKEAFLRPWWPGGERSAEVSLDGRLIDALKDLVSDGNQIDPTHSPTVYDWRKVVTRLTPWRWSRSVLELQLSLKQLAIRSSSESTAPEAEALLANLTRTVFERNLSSDETDLICEGLAGTEVGPIEKFAISGLNRLADILVSYDPSSPAAQERFTSFTDSAGNVLRVLSGTLAQARTPEGESPPRAPSSAQDRLPEAILEMLQKLEGQLVQVHRVEGSSSSSSSARMKGSSSSSDPEAARTEGSLSTSQLRSLLILMLRSLHVALGFSRMGIIDLWTAKAKTSMELFLKVQMGLISMHAGTQVLEEGLFALLIDTLWYYIDELPKDLRAGCISTLRNLQISCAYERNPSIPDDLRSQIKRILPYVSPDPLVENLVVSTNPSDPSLVDTVKAQARPWEWIEFTDPPAPNPAHREAYPASQVVKNNASMNLTLFQAEGTRDRLPEPSTSSKFAEPASTTKEEEPWKAFESERSYADDLEGSTTFARDWARSRVRKEEVDGASGGDDSKSSVDGSGSTVGGAAPSPMQTVPTPTASASTLPVPSSSRPSTTNKRKASVSSSSTSKAARGSTAADAVVIEDDDEPPAKVQKQGGRTGGKTTGGKTTAAKAPAGGKKGRKKSGN